VHAGFRQAFRDADLFIFGKNDTGLLLAVAQGDVVDLDVLGELEVLGDFRRVVPLADEPVVRLPGGIGPPFTPLTWVWLGALRAVF
jgi:hypothetical protein